MPVRGGAELRQQPFGRPIGSTPRRLPSSRPPSSRARGHRRDREIPDRHGKFASWDDLLKVPGVDAAALEEQRKNVVFESE
jgi:hypothetical protein